MLNQKFPILLASKSPRRQELMTLMDLEFEVVLKDVDESYPDGMAPHEIASYISEKKAKAFMEDKLDALLITADTIVALNGEILGKPGDAAHAREMLKKLSNTTHEVYTGVSIAMNDQVSTFYDRTAVTFGPLSQEQIDYYITHYNPFDKAGSYGIQDWIGMIAISKIEGSYTNVMGLPTEKLYTVLAAL